MRVHSQVCSTPGKREFYETSFRTLPLVVTTAEDIGEKSNLAGKIPEKAQELKKLYDEWEKELQKPKWIRQDNRRAGAKRASQRNPETAEQQMERRFKRLDRNGDGRLDTDEVRNVPRFAGADLNRDGVVTLEEAKRHILKR